MFDTTLLQVRSFDNFIWTRWDGKGGFSVDEFDTLSFPDIVLHLGERQKNYRGDTYLRVLSTKGIVWIGEWCLGHIGGGLARE